MSEITRAFIYARKSTDTEDRQVYSIDHQFKELRELAAKQNIEVVAEFEEHRTAKAPGRPVFNEMIARIKKGEASLILAWHPDRLARNSVDGGAIMYYIDTGIVANLKFVAFWFEPTPQGMLMLSIAFGMSKYHVDSMSQGIKRTYKRRVEEGFWPRKPPLGYIFDRNSRLVVFDSVRAPLVRQAFELYASGECSLDEVRREINNRGFRTRKGKKHPSLPAATSRYHFMLQNPFYAGMLRYRGELFEGKHEPIVPLALFDRCQIVLAQRGWRKSVTGTTSLYGKMFRCGECGCAITNESHKGHVYLRGTRHSGSCLRPYLREEEATRQIANILRKVIVPQEIIDALVADFTAQQAKESDSIAAEVKQLHVDIEKVMDKERRLTEVYVEGSLPALDFQKKKEKLLRNKRILTEKLTFLENNPKKRFEPAIRFCRGLTKPQSVVTANSPRELRDFFKKVGSNLSIKDGRVMCDFRGPWKTVAAQGFFAARRRVASEPVASNFVARTNFSVWCSARDEDRIRQFMDSMRQFFKDNPCWE